MDDGTGPLASLLRQLILALGDPLDPKDGRPRISILLRVLGFCRESKVARASMILFFAGNVVDVLVSEGDTRRMPLSMMLGIYSSMACYTVLVRHKEDITTALRQAHRVAERLHRDGSPRSREVLQLMASRCRFVAKRFYPTYAALLALGTVSSFDHQTGVNQSLKGQKKILLIIRQVIEAFSSICGHVCLYTLLSYVLVIFASCSLLLREVGRVVKQTGKVGDAAAMHVQLVLGCSRMNAAFGVYLPHIAVAPSVIPLLSTVTIIMSAEKADMYVAGSFPAVLFYLAPLCEVGDMLVAGSDTFCFSAYCGPWLEEGPATRRCRWLLMSAPTMNLSAPGMVSVNRPTLRKAARTWFQFLQVLIKLKA
ncbi:uncharacterized protein LOC127750687 isoform X3 [Frankliniella occidentalis]|uniref:Uncharacterized protein LOC127750687 isoform X3 n=1 Tax=Frankliniella occidentalis TaxID=133901 RepID=A0A9C6X4D6_FRAOC|nr:uncharacterized protein LOC127750687 isoform X3 [Frankliniella occidentalis]